MKVGKDQYGEAQSSFELPNPLTVALNSPRVAVVCTDAAGAIIGGGSEYLELIPASGKVKVDANLIVSGKPDDCTVCSGPPIDWDGEGTDATAGAPSVQPSGTPQADARSPEAAFKTWMDQFNAKDWATQ